MRRLSRILSLAALALIAPAALAQTAEITRFSTIHGEVAHLENASGRSTLKFLTKGNTVQLPASWGGVAVEQVTQLNGQTAILMSHSDTGCASRMSLAVVDRETFWGPYAVGGCEDILVHQRGADGNDWIAMRADTNTGMAWVYSVADSRFRGPVPVTLPASMAMMVPQAPIRVPSPTSTPAGAAPAPVGPRPVAPAAAPRPTTTAPVTATATAPKSTGLSPQEASSVASQTRNAPPARVLRIDL